jgi:hypothetical protein
MNVILQEVAPLSAPTGAGCDRHQNTFGLNNPHIFRKHLRYHLVWRSHERAGAISPRLGPEWLNIFICSSWQRSSIVSDRAIRISPQHERSGLSLQFADGPGAGGLSALRFEDQQSIANCIKPELYRSKFVFENCANFVRRPSRAAPDLAIALAASHGEQPKIAARSRYTRRVVQAWSQPICCRSSRCLQLSRLPAISKIGPRLLRRPPPTR